MSGVVKRLIWALTANAFLSGAMAPWALAANALSADPVASMAASADCGTMDMTGDMAGHLMDVEKSGPRKSMTIDCMVQMGCVGISGAILATFDAFAAPVSYSDVSYSSPASAGSGLSTAPDPFPPKSHA